MGRASGRGTDASSSTGGGFSVECWVLKSESEEAEEVMSLLDLVYLSAGEDVSLSRFCCSEDSLLLVVLSSLSSLSLLFSFFF